MMILGIAQRQDLFPQATATADHGRVRLTLQPNCSISYPPTLDTFVQNNPATAKKVGFAFKKYQLLMIELSHLQAKIDRYTARIQTPKVMPPALQGELQLTREMMDSIFLEKKAFEDQAKLRPLLVLIGKTGTGKSTLANHLSGCRMKQVNLNEIYDTINHRRVIVAEHPVSKIGLNPNKAQTSFPEIVSVPVEKTRDFSEDDCPLSICDCPGFGDTRGLKVALYNSLAIVKALESTPAIKGFIVVIEYPKLLVDKGLGIKENFQYLHQLLKSFEPYKNSILLVITKVNDPQETLIGIIDRLIEAVQSWAQNNQEEPRLRSFFNEVLNSRILDEGSHKVVIETPLDQTGANRRSILDVIRVFPSITPAAGMFGFPISDGALGTYQTTMLSIKGHVKDTLSRLCDQIDLYQKGKTTQATIEETHDALELLNDAIKRFPTSANVNHFATDPFFIGVSKELTGRLKECESTLISLNKLPGIVAVGPVAGEYDQYLQNLSTAVIVARDRVEESSLEKMFNEMKTSLEEGLQSYEARQGVSSIAQTLAIRSLRTADSAGVYSVLTALSDYLIGTNLPHWEHVPKILISERRLGEIKEIIERYVVNPLDIPPVVNDTISIVARIKKVALSEILLGIRDFQKVMTLTIEAKFPFGEGVVYFDTSVTQVFEKVTWLSIDAGQITVVNGPHVIKADVSRRGFLSPKKTIFLQGLFKGSDFIDSAQERLILSSSDAQPIDKGIICSWPF